MPPRSWDDLQEALQAAENIPDPDARAETVVEAGLVAGRELENLRTRYQTPEIEGFGANQSLRRGLNAYDALFSKQEAEVLQAAAMQVRNHGLGSLQRAGGDLPIRSVCCGKASSVWVIRRQSS